MLSFFGAENSPSLPDPSYKGRNASAIFGAGPSFGLTPAEVNIRPQFRPAPVRKTSEPRKVKRSNSDAGIRKKPTSRRKSGDFAPLRKHSESESETALNGAVCNGENSSLPPLSPRLEACEAAADSVTSLPEHSKDSNDFSNRYPLFIQVNDNAQSQSKARVLKPVIRPANQATGKQETAQNKRSLARKRSASFTSVRKATDSRLPPAGPVPRTSPAANQPSQESSRIGQLRREKSDVVKSRRAQPATSTAIPRPKRAHSSSNLKHDKSGVVSPRSQSPCSSNSELSDISKKGGTQGLRREKSDTVRPRGQSPITSPSISNENLDSGISRSSSSRSLTSSPLNKCPSKNSIPEGSSLSNNNTEMSKIPSLARSPTSSETHVSRIPSLTKKNGAEERTPPRSKIPSVNRNDRGQEPAMTKSQIPTGGRKHSGSHKDKVVSKIPSSTALSPSRPDSSKENKDPTKTQTDGETQNGHDTAKQLSKIPSFGKSGIPKSKIPSVTRKDSRSEEQSTLNVSSDGQSPVSHAPGEASKSKIPTSPNSSQGSSGIPVGQSRIPAFTKSPQQKQDTKPNHPAVNQSRIPTFPSAPENKTSESKIPTSGGSKIPEPNIASKSPPSSLPVAKTAKIATDSTPEEQSAPPSRILGYSGEKLLRKTSNTEKEHVQSNLPVTSSPIDTKSKIPSVSGIAAPKSTSTDGSEKTPSRPKYSIPTLGGRQLSLEREVQGPGAVPPTTPPSTPTLQTSAPETSLDMDIFSEAKKMEQLLRNAPVELKTSVEDREEEDDDFLLQEKEIERLEKEHDIGLEMVESKEAEDLISEVLKSYAPDINKENEPALQNIMDEATEDDSRNLNDKVNVDDIIFHALNSEDKVLDKSEEPPPVKEEIKLSLHTDEIHESPITGKVETEQVKQVPKVPDTQRTFSDTETSTIVDNAPFGKLEESQKPASSETEGTKTEGPPIDTLGEYAQQARRSRSRQRKVVSPDSEEPEREAEKEPEKESPKESQESTPKEQPKKDINKDKFGTAPFEGEKKAKESSKPAKSKSKNEKPKFVIESSLGKDFYSSRKSDEIAQSKESVQEDDVSSKKRELPNLVFENKVAKQPVELKTETAPRSDQAVALEVAKFEDIDLNSEPGIKKEKQEIFGSRDDLDEKTVKCMCGRGGKCSIM